MKFHHTGPSLEFGRLVHSIPNTFKPVLCFCRNGVGCDLLGFLGVGLIIAVFGCGGHASVVIDTIEAAGEHEIRYVVCEDGRHKRHFRYPTITDDEFFAVKRGWATVEPLLQLADFASL